MADGAYVPSENIITLSHEELKRLHQEGQIGVWAHMSSSMFVCDNDPRIPMSVRAAHHFWKWVGLLATVGGLISIFFIPWYWGIAIFLGGLFVMKAVRQSAGQFVVEAVLKDGTLYRDCLANGILMIRWKTQAVSHEGPKIAG